MENSDTIEVFKTFKAKRTGRPRSAILDEKGRNIKAIEYSKQWCKNHKEYMRESNRKSEQKRREHFNQCVIVVNVLKELIKQQKVSLPNELIQLVQAA